MCVGINYPFFRVFVRNAGSAQSSLAVDLLYLRRNGQVARTLRLGTLSAGSAWGPTRRISLAIGQSGTGGSQEQVPVAFRFTPEGAAGAWQIDELYVDPYARG